MNPFINRRQKLISQLPQDSLTILFAGEPLRKSADSEHLFESNRNYYYLTGLNEPNGILVLANTKKGPRELLFIRDIDYDKEKWIGRFISVEQAQTTSGIDSVMFVSTFESFFTRSLISMEIKTVGLDGDRQNLSTQPLSGEQFATTLKQSYPLLQLIDVYGLIAQMRLIKDDYEISKIKDAIQLTHQAIEAMVSELAPNKKEYEVSARYMYEVLKNNGTEMFDTIAASGPNGVILHYVENNREMLEGDLVLFDLGAKLDHYGADISRTYPVNGRFTDRQKQIYEIVLKAMDAVTKATKPNVTLIELNNVCKEVLSNELMTIGLIKEPSELIKYYYHSVSHHLGLDTHDVGNTENTLLEPGMVITNEPGLYIAEENIGIRIETDLLVTKEGCVDLAPMIKKEVKDIEALMTNSK